MFLKRIQMITALTVMLVLSASLAAAQLPDLTGLAESAGNAVVNISTVKKVQGQNLPKNFFQAPKGSPFGDFFEQFEKFFGQQGPRNRDQHSLGSGFIISKDGYIVTNNHVIEGADEISVKLHTNGKNVDAKIVGQDEDTDLALLKIDAGDDLPTLSFADSDNVKVGQWVMAIGNPFGLGHTVTAGIISAKGRVINAGPYDNFLQTDASINPGNSGGPLINLDGKVVGINTAIIASGQGIGFAIPSSMAEDIIVQLKSGKAISRGWLGIRQQDLTEESAKALGLEDLRGALVNEAFEGDPAAKAGVKAGDVILEVNGTPVEDIRNLSRMVAAIKPGQRAKLTLWRNGKKKYVTVVMEERSKNIAAQKNGAPGPGSGPNNEGSTAELGLSLRPPTPDEANQLGLEKVMGLIVTGVDQGSAAAQGDVRPGDIIIEVNQTRINSVGDFNRVVTGDGKKKGVVMFLIKRQGQNIFRTVPLN